ncbi:MAG: hypothetical protein SGPRY_011966 [Prymnesium sp.]
MMCANWILSLANPKTSKTAKEVSEKVHDLTSQDPMEHTTAYRVAGNEAGSLWAAAVRKGPLETHPINPRRERQTGWARGLAWFTLATLVAVGGQTPWAQIAICATRQFITHDGTTTSLMQMGRHALGEVNGRPGKGPLLTPTRSKLQAEQKLTPRQLVESSAEGIEQLRAAMLQDESALATYYQMWSESISPLQLSETPEDLMDIQLDLLDEARDRELFAPRLPVYELPWLERMPQQVDEAGCHLLDYTAPINTNFNLPHLERLFSGYPDRRLASNVLEGIRLEADVEMQIVVHPNLVSVLGDGYDSVQDTVRELAGRGFYDLQRLLPFAPTYVIGQGSRIKKLGAKKVPTNKQLQRAS